MLLAWHNSFKCHWFFFTKSQCGRPKDVFDTFDGTTRKVSNTIKVEKFEGPLLLPPCVLTMYVSVVDEGFLFSGKI